MSNPTVITKENKVLGEKYYYFRHISGLDVYLFPKDLTTSYALFGTSYGSIDNCFIPDGKSELEKVPDGIAHFLEHKMFECEDGSDLFEKFALTGASANAYTSYTHTMYLFSCTENFKKSLEILLDGIKSPYFTKENVAKEQGIIAQEIKMYEDNVHDALFQGLISSMYSENAVRVPIAGTVESISKITPELLYKCYDTFYRLSNMSLCVCGNIDISDVIDVCDRVLKEEKPIKIESVRSYPSEKPEVASSRFSRKMRLSKPIFAIGVKDVNIPKDPAERLKKRVTMEILAGVLFGECSPLSVSLYEQGLTRNPISFYVDHNDAFSFFEIGGESDDPEEVFERFKAHIESVKSAGISEDDLKRVARALYGEFISIFDSSANIANEFLPFIMEGYDVFDYIDTFENITADGVNSALHELFNENFYTLATIYPQDENK
ncbi:MAG: insulinase family protein [Ruminococcaceae bacterium]|nr:insulinase family protein [Oscillospiraceae bacterium]